MTAMASRDASPQALQHHRIVDDARADGSSAASDKAANSDLPRLAYLINTYPVTSGTFIRREIEALEELGFDITRFAVRKWTNVLVDPRDIREQQRTRYLLSGDVSGLVWSAIAAVLTRPLALGRAASVWVNLLRNSRFNTIRLVAYFLQAISFSKESKRLGIRHVHVHFATNATTVAMLSHLMGGPTYSFTVHGPDELIDPLGQSFAIKIKNAAFVVAISSYCQNFLRNHAAPEDWAKIILARCGLALEEFRHESAVASNTQTLVCVGRLCHQKGQILIPKAAAALRKQFPALRIVLIGDGDIRAALEEEIKRHDVADIIELRGWLDNTAVLATIRASRVLLLPSYAEGLPVVIMEALALGTPVISTTIAGIPELVDRNCGWLFEAGDEQGLIDAIRAALECPTARLEKMAEIGRARVFEMHDRRKLARVLAENFVESSS